MRGSGPEKEHPFRENADMSNVKCGQNPHGRKLQVFSVRLRYVRVNWCLTLNWG